MHNSSVFKNEMLSKLDDLDECNFHYMFLDTPQNNTCKVYTNMLYRLSVGEYMTTFYNVCPRYVIVENKNDKYG